MTPTRLLALLLLLAPSARAQFCSLAAGDTVRRIVTCRAGTSMADCAATALSAGCAVVRELPSIRSVVIEVNASQIGMAESKLGMARQVQRVYTDNKVNWLKGAAPALRLPDFNLPELSGVIAPFRTGAVKAPAEAAADPEQPWGIQRVKASLAWGRTEGQGVKVAIIDTGADRRHPEIADALAGGFNALDANKPDAWDDDQGHGSHVAGTIAAKKDGQGVVGVAPKARLYAVKVLDADGNGTYSDVIAGIEWAVAHKMDVANMSLGADEGSEPLQKAIQAATAAGLTIVAAAGNTGAAVGFPARYPETIAVAASDDKDRVAFFSSRGPEVDFIAPGVDVLSVKLGGGFDKLSGTSMACPHMTGLAALAVSLGAHGPDAVRSALAAAASKLAGLTPEQQGLGMVDAGKLARKRDPLVAALDADDEKVKR